jgi:drug/metabolite transporter (DMT)-like permease
MVSTSIYSISDKLATGSLPGFAEIIGFVSVGYSAAFITLTLALRHQTGRWTPPQRIPLSIMMVGGLCVGLAYALVIHTMRFLPSAEVVAYSNTGIVLATLASIYVFGERQRSAWYLTARAHSKSFCDQTDLSVPASTSSSRTRSLGLFLPAG